MFIRNGLLFLFLFLSTGFGQSRPDIRAIEVGGRTVRYEVQDGFAVTRGDILLGTAEELEAAARDPKPGDPRLASAVGTTTPLWTNGVMYYAIDPGVPNQSRIEQAVEHWNSRTPLKILPRTAEPNYVRFVRPSAQDSCSSFLGMRGGAQTINAGDLCGAMNLVHELGHAFGLNHEQERLDRNAWVTVLNQNIEKRYAYNFDQTISSRDLNYYDYDSIMHYPATGFTRNGYATIETVPVGIPIGQRLSLSAGDIDSVSRLYGFSPAQTTITTMPAGQPIIVDGARATSPQSFDWVPGSRHTVSVDQTQGTDPQYVFVRWSDGGDITHTITASAERTVFAAAFQRRHRFTASVNSGQGSISVSPPSADGYYPERAFIALTATPGPREQFMGWSGTVNLANWDFGSATQSILVEATQVNATLRASFSSDVAYTVTSDPPKQTVTVDGRDYLTPARFSWTPGSTHSISIEDLQSGFSTSERFRFTSWEDRSVSLSRTLTVGSESATYTARFTPQYLLEMVVGGGNGTLSSSPTSRDGFFNAGATVEVTARPLQSTQVVRYWLTDTAGSGDTKTLVMDQPKTATAVFGTRLPFRPVHAASYQGTFFPDLAGSSIAPLEILTLFGDDVGPASLTSGSLDSSGRMNTRAGDTRILFDGVAAPIIYASANQTSVVAPAAVGGRTAITIAVERNGTLGAGITFGAAATIPGLFTANASGLGPVAALNQDGSINSAARPAEKGTVVALYGSGAGSMDRNLIDGEIMGADLARPKAPVFVRFSKQPGQIFYAGSAPFAVNGALQINVQVPTDLALSGEVPIQLMIGNWASPPGTTIFVK
jgi:uncharacterized protein (TIGR03437 family)